MRIGISRYFSDLTELLEKIHVTDGSNNTIDLTSGIERAVRLIQERTSKNSKIIFIGNGGSASIASHQAIDFLKNGGMRAMAFTDPSFLTCLSNDLGYGSVFEKPIEMFADKGDVVVAISSSGRSENILRGVKAGRKRGTYIITMSGFKADNPLRTMGDINFYLPSLSYGHVEIVHLVLCHCIVDIIIENRASEEAMDEKVAFARR